MWVLYRLGWLHLAKKIMIPQLVASIAYLAKRSSPPNDRQAGLTVRFRHREFRSAFSSPARAGAQHHQLDAREVPPLLLGTLYGRSLSHLPACR